MLLERKIETREAKGIQVYDSMEIKEFNKFIDDMN